MILRNEKCSEITCQNINLHSSAVCRPTISIRAVTSQRQRILLDKCSVKLERIKRMPYMHTT